MSVESKWLLDANSHVGSCGWLGTVVEGLIVARSCLVGLPKPNSFSYSALLDACEKASHWSEAVQVLHGLPGKRMPRETILLNSVLSACGKAASWLMACRLIHAPNEVSFNALLATLGAVDSSGPWQVGQEVIGRMRAREMRPDLISFNSLMTIFERKLLWRQAQTLFDHLKAHVQQDVVTQNGLLAAHGRAKHWAMANSLLSGRDVVAVMACMSASPWQVALDMGDSDLQVAILAACERGGAWQLALAQPLRDCHELSAALGACTASHVADKGVKLGMEMVATRLELDLVATNAVLGAWARLRGWSRSLELMPREPDLISFSAGLTACALRPREALDLWDALACYGLKPDSVALGCTMAACQNGHLWREVLHLWQESPGTEALQIAERAMSLSGQSLGLTRLLKQATVTGALACEALWKGGGGSLGVTLVCCHVAGSWYLQDTGLWPEAQPATAWSEKVDGGRRAAHLPAARPGLQVPLRALQGWAPER